MTYGIVLAAGLGTRMRSGLAKVLHPVLGKPMVRHVVDAVTAAGIEPVVVVHHQEARVRDALPGVLCVTQEVPRGTGDAVRAALGALPRHGTIIVVSGDVPLLRSETLSALVARHGGALCTVVSAVLDDGGRYGRIVRDAAGAPVRIVEASEATDAELAVREINTGTYAFDLDWLHTAVPDLEVHEPKGEIYLTDLLARAAATGRAQVFTHDDPDELGGVNDRWELGVATRALQRRIVRTHAIAGVTFDDIDHVEVEPDVVLDEDVRIGAGAVLRGRCRIASGAVVEPHCVLVDTEVGPGAVVRAGSVCEHAVVGARAVVGPMARLREGTVLAEDVRVGNFVETKKAKLGRGAKVNHLAYVGDAVVGERSNIGAGVIFANYDGVGKHASVVGSDAFVGSNSVLVAPVHVGDGGFVAAGSTITRDVGPDELAIGRARQVGKPGMARKVLKKP